ncbi:MAG: hypothetical protein KatS3mg048_3504 [Caldilinea sp.]|nr:MAG: hypothetical protein KatS3mg048_3504 [Caldilinea sp.]
MVAEEPRLSVVVNGAAIIDLQVEQLVKAWKGQ